jgi:ATP adenylyltransferase/5',5'''-P-1,P-4-tetraphosphate phosphorylase II
VLQDLPGIYSATVASADLNQPVQPNLTLTPEAIAVIEKLWNYFDQTGEKTLNGAQDYNFQVEKNWLVVVPKDNAQEFFAISRDGQVNSTFSNEQQESLMERFAIA